MFALNVCFCSLRNALRSIGRWLEREIKGPIAVLETRLHSCDTLADSIEVREEIEEDVYR